MATIAGLAGIGKPGEESAGQDTCKLHHRRVYRFIRPGVDILMENRGLSDLKPKKWHGRVSYFLAPGVEREKIDHAAWDRKNFRHVDYFAASRIEKGEGYTGGGSMGGGNILQIGFNPWRQFREFRIKRQHAMGELATEKHTKISPKKPQPPLNAKTFVEILQLKRHHEEAAAEMKVNELNKAKLKQERAIEKKKEYEDIMNYDPWGQPAAGAPKITKSGKIRAQLCGINLEGDATAQYDPFGMPRKYPQASSAPQDGYGRKKVDDLSDIEKQKFLREQERREYYVACLDKQRTSNSDRKIQENQIVPSDFIWGRTEVKRNVSGKIIPRKRQLYEVDNANVHKSYKTYLSIADRMVRLPGHLPMRGMIDTKSYRQWGRPGSRAIMRHRDGPLRYAGSKVARWGKTAGEQCAAVRNVCVAQGTTATQVKCGAS